MISPDFEMSFAQDSKFTVKAQINTIAPFFYIFPSPYQCLTSTWVDMQWQKKYVNPFEFLDFN